MHILIFVKHDWLLSLARNFCEESLHEVFQSFAKSIAVSWNMHNLLYKCGNPLGIAFFFSTERVVEIYHPISSYMSEYIMTPMAQTSTGKE